MKGQGKKENPAQAGPLLKRQQEQKYGEQKLLT